MFTGYDGLGFWSSDILSLFFCIVLQLRCVISDRRSFHPRFGLGCHGRAKMGGWQPQVDSTWTPFHLWSWLLQNTLCKWYTSQFQGFTVEGKFPFLHKLDFKYYNGKKVWLCTATVVVRHYNIRGSFPAIAGSNCLKIVLDINYCKNNLQWNQTSALRPSICYPVNS